jgi:hypothetical protein
MIFKFLLPFFFLISSTAIFAQRNLSIYNLTATPQSYLLNPGRMPLSNMYISLPIIGGINASYGNSSFTFANLNLLNNNTGNEQNNNNFFSNNFKDFLGALKPQNHLYTDASINLLGFGMKLGAKNYVSFQATENINVQVDYPRSLFELFDDVSRDQVTANKTYSLSNLNFNAVHYRSFALGFTRQINSKFSAGGRVKYLMGVANMTTLNQGFQMTNDPQNQTFKLEGALGFFSSGIQTLTNDPAYYLLGNGNSGLAFDLGAQYMISPKLEVSASVINIGGINWKNDLTFSSLNNSNVTFSSNDIDDFSNGVANYIDSISRGTVSTPNPYRINLPTTAYFSTNYYITPTTSAGILISPRFYNNTVEMAFAGNVQTRIHKIFQAGLTFSYFNSSANLGTGLSVDLGPVQIYVASDNIISAFKAQNAKNIHGNVGINLNFGRKTRAERIAEFTPKLSPADSLKMAMEEQEKLKKAEDKKQGKTDTAPNATAAAVAANNNKPNPATGLPPLGPSVNFKGVVMNEESKEILLNTMLEVYRQKTDGSQELVLNRNFYNGNLGTLLLRDQSYKLVVKKNGFLDQEVLISTADMTNMAVIEKDVFLTAGQKTPPSPAVVTPPVKNPTTKPGPDTVPPNPTVHSPVHAIGVYTIKENTYIKASPDNESTNLLRMVPGYRVLVLEKTSPDWWKISFRDYTGYVLAKLMVVEK